LEALQQLELDEFQGIRDEWNSLVTHDPNGSIFDTWEWLSSFWKTHEKSISAKPLILVYRSNGELKGAAPLRLMGHRIRFFGLRTVAVEFLAQGPSDYNTILISPDCNKRDFFQMLRDYMANSSLQWDRINLGNIAGDPVASSLLYNLGIRFYPTPLSGTPYVSLPKDWESYNQSLGKNLRRNIKRRRRQLETDYAVDFRVYDNPTDEDIADFLDLHTQRMRQSARSGILADAGALNFHMEFARLASKQGWIRLHVIKVGAKPIASLYGFVFKGRFCFYNQGFDPVFSKYSPLLQLTAESIRHSIAQSLHEYDFLRGTEAYKFDWTQDVRDYHSLELVNRKPSSVMKRLVELGADPMSALGEIHPRALVKDSLRTIRDRTRRR
jgi:CelD/BcsL family acetyltransferase involved in cellulose biosynthesis